MALIESPLFVPLKGLRPPRYSAAISRGATVSGRLVRSRTFWTVHRRGIVGRVDHQAGRTKRLCIFDVVDRAEIGAGGAAVRHALESGFHQYTQLRYAPCSPATICIAVGQRLVRRVVHRIE